jgi:hypothetical protein
MVLLHGVGEAVGLVGDAVGLLEGASVGDPVGLLEGEVVGVVASTTTNERKTNKAILKLKNEYDECSASYTQIFIVGI